MKTLHPIAIAVSLGLLEACVTTPAKPQLSMQPVLRIQHSADQAATTYAQLGKYHLERGDLNLAITAYTYAISLDKQQLDSRNGLATIYARQGNLDDAKSILLQLVTEFPAVAYPYNNLGYVYYLQGDYAQAIATLQRAIAIDADNARAQNNLRMAQAAAASQIELAILRNSIASTTRENNVAPQQVMSQAPEEASGGSALSKQISAIEPQAKQAPDGDSPTVMETARFGTESPSKLVLVQTTPRTYNLVVRQAVPKGEKLAGTHADLIGPIPTAPALIPMSRLAVTPQATCTASAGLAEMTTRSITGRRMLRIEIANGNGVNGMAKTFMLVLGERGITVDRLINDRPYRQNLTEIQYRPGFEHEAKTLRDAIGKQAFSVRPREQSSRYDLRLVLGKDAVV